MTELLLPEGSWREMLGVSLRAKPQATRVRIACLNAVPTTDGQGLHRWLHRGDTLRLLYAEAQRLESPDLKRLADRINESTTPKE